MILPLTGGGAFLGKAEQQALQQYEKVVNAGGGIHGKPLKFVFNDDQSSPQVAVQLANQVKAPIRRSFWVRRWSRSAMRWRL